MRAKTILIVDDEPRTRQGLQKMLERWSEGRIRIMTADNGRSALDLLEHTKVDLMISDIRMPEISGLALVDRLQADKMAHQPSVILISGHAEFDYAYQAIQLGVVNYLLKPISRDKLIQAIERALEADEERNRVGMMRKIVDKQLLETTANNDAHLSDSVRDALGYVDAHLEQMVGLSEVAEHVRLNASYFSVLFKEQMQMTLSEYIARRKLQKAKELLLTTKIPVAEIAERVGYQTAKYFNKVFKEYEGRSPGQFRTENNVEKSEI